MMLQSPEKEDIYRRSSQRDIGSRARGAGADGVAGQIEIRSTMFRVTLRRLRWGSDSSAP